jgi:hypothetical protein
VVQQPFAEAREPDEIIMASAKAEAGFRPVNVV